MAQSGHSHITARQNAAVDQAWKEGHDRLATLSSRGSNTVVPNISHYIQIDQPKAVIDAALKAVSQVRQSHVPRRRRKVADRPVNIGPFQNLSG